MSTTAQALAKLNKFDLSHGVKGTMDMGKLYPVGYIETVPNDWFKIQQEFLCRFLATLAPVMHLFKIRFHWYYTPFRILLERGVWDDFITGGKDGTDSTVLPYISSGANGFAKGSLADYFGMPVGIPNLKVSAFPFRAYAMIYNEVYRNQALQDEVALSFATGQDTTTNTDVLKRPWQRDYFTNQLPSPQKGPAVALPLASSSAPVFSAQGNVSTDALANLKWFNGDTGVISNSGGPIYPLTVGNYGATYSHGPAVGAEASYQDVALSADLSEVTAVSIEQVRRAFAVQKFQYHNMIWGNRYTEWIQSTFGIKPLDASLQRPQHVGGFTTPMVISEVLQTSETTADSAQGNMAGHGVGAGTSQVIRFHSYENGCLMCLMSIMPSTDYYQGLRRDFSRETRYDFLQPLLSRLGEQGTKNKEIYAQGSSVTDDDGNVVDDKIFGYAPRYQEYRQIPSYVVGEMRDTLEYWQDGRKFSELPVLNNEFIESTPSTRIFAVEQNTDHIVFQVANHVKALRPLDKYGRTGLVA